MTRKKLRLLLAAASLLVLGGAYSLVYGAGVSQQTATLTGTVSANQLAVAGQTVEEGDTLVMVNSIAGLVPAARANINGKVSAVLVKAGDKIQNGQVVAEITPNQ